MLVRQNILARGGLLLVAAGVLLAGCAGPGKVASGARDEASSSKTVRGMMQARPGGPLEEVEVGVHRVPVDLPEVSAGEAELQDDDLVLGVVIDGQPKAYPIRYIAMYEVVDDRVGKLPVASTW